jgi:hypothetical protein
MSKKKNETTTTKETETANGMETVENKFSQLKDGDIQAIRIIVKLAWFFVATAGQFAVKGQIDRKGAEKTAVKVSNAIAEELTICTYGVESVPDEDD